jgi:Flp pilus assembly protein TadB
VNNDSPEEHHLRFLRGVLGHDQIDQRPVIKPPRTARGFLAGIGNLIVGIALVLSSPPWAGIIIVLLAAILFVLVSRR